MLIGMKNKATKIVTGMLFALLILSFAIWGIGDIFHGGSQMASVAEVGSVTIEQREFGRRLGREINNLRQRFGSRFDASQAQALGIVDQVLQQLITRALFDQQAAEMDMAVSDERVRERIIREPAFQNALGDFDRARFFQVLRQSDMSEQQFIATLIRDINRQQIVEAVTGATAAPKTLAEALFVYQREQRVAETVRIAEEALPPLPTPSEENLVEIHEEYSSQFLAPEYRDVSIIYLRADDLISDTPASEEELRQEFENRRDDFRVPEIRQVEQMVFADETEAANAKDRLDGGEAFDAVSQSALGRSPVDLGRVSRADLDLQLPELGAAIFDLSEGAVGGPVQSPFGWHLVHVTAVEPGQEPDFARVRDELAEDRAMRLAIDSMIELANDLDDELGSGASLEEAAEVLQLTLRQIPAIDAGGNDLNGEAIADLPPASEFAAAVFETEPGSDSLLTETRDGNYFVVRVNSITPATARPIEEVRDEVVALWQDLERDRLTRERAEALAQRVRDGEAFAEVAEAEGLALTVTQPVTRRQTESQGLPSRELAAKLFEIDPGEVTVAAAPDAYLVAKLIEVRPADPGSDPEAVVSIQDGLAGSLQRDILSGFVASLRKEHGVTINDRAVQQILSNL